MLRGQANPRTGEAPSQGAVDKGCGSPTATAWGPPCPCWAATSPADHSSKPTETEHDPPGEVAASPPRPSTCPAQPAGLCGEGEFNPADGGRAFFVHVFEQAPRSWRPHAPRHAGAPAEACARRQASATRTHARSADSQHFCQLIALPEPAGQAGTGLAAGGSTGAPPGCLCRSSEARTVPVPGERELGQLGSRKGPSARTKHPAGLGPGSGVTFRAIVTENGASGPAPSAPQGSRTPVPAHT